EYCIPAAKHINKQTCRGIRLHLFRGRLLEEYAVFLFPVGAELPGRQSVVKLVVLDCSAPLISSARFSRTLTWRLRRSGHLRDCKEWIQVVHHEFLHGDGSVLAVSHDHVAEVAV